MCHEKPDKKWRKGIVCNWKGYAKKENENILLTDS
jgi:hypothetical protein